MSTALHCDAPHCELWALRDSSMSQGWVSVHEDNHLVGHYCSLDHAMQGLAELSRPNEEVRL